MKLEPLLGPPPRARPSLDLLPPQPVLTHRRCTGTCAPTFESWPAPWAGLSGPLEGPGWAGCWPGLSGRASAASPPLCATSEPGRKRQRGAGGPEVPSGRATVLQSPARPSPQLCLASSSVTQVTWHLPPAVGREDSRSDGLPVAALANDHELRALSNTDLTVFPFPRPESERSPAESRRSVGWAGSRLGAHPRPAPPGLQASRCNSGPSLQLYSSRALSPPTSALSLCVPRL